MGLRESLSGPQSIDRAECRCLSVRIEAEEYSDGSASTYPDESCSFRDKKLPAGKMGMMAVTETSA